MSADLALHAAPGQLGFWRRYLFSTDHKTIAKQYLILGIVMAVVGGLLAYMMRWQLAWPETQIPLAGWIPEPYGFDGRVPPDFYNAMVTMHGTIMVFFVGMPIALGAFGNLLIPLMIGAKDMAFPRHNMISFWTLALGTIVLMASFFMPGGSASAGWTGYPPLATVPQFTGSNWGINLWILALALEFASALMGGINYLTTAITMRAPGMTWFRLPLMVWMQLTAAVLFMLSVGPIIAGALLMLADRTVGTGFFLPPEGGDPLLWQHLFWFFGHPEVYVLLLPELGVLLEIIPAKSRRPVFGYKAIIYSTIAAGILSFIVWAHHMFISGMDPTLAAPFSILTILISVPFAIVLFALIATLWRGSIRFSTGMLFALGTVAMFLMGGVTGIFNGSAAVDIYIHDTYFVVAHFHYTLFPVVFLGGLAGIYHWFPKMFGRHMNEVWGKIHFWTTFVLAQAVFLPMFVLGIAGHMRRLYNPTAYEFLQPYQPTQQLITIAVVALVISQIPFLVNFFRSIFAGKQAEANPWQAATLEWTVPSPAPHGNFDKVPTVYHGPYEYSQPGEAADFVPQDQPMRNGHGSNGEGAVAPGAPTTPTTPSSTEEPRQ